MSRRSFPEWTRAWWLYATLAVRITCRAMNVQFISSFAVISSDIDASRKFFVDELGLPLTASDDGEYLLSEGSGGVALTSMAGSRKLADAHTTAAMAFAPNVVPFDSSSSYEMTFVWVFTKSPV